MAARGARPPARSGGKSPKRRRTGCVACGCVMLVVLLLATAFALDQYNIVRIPLGEESRIPRMLPGAREDEVVDDEESVVEDEVESESAVADAEAAAAQRLDRLEGESAESASAPLDGVEGRSEVVVEPPMQTESAPPLRVTLPAGGLASLDPKSPAAIELRRRIQDLGSILQAMKPKSAAETLQRMPLPLQVEALRTMDSRAVAKILDEMPADARGKIAVALVE